MPKERSSLKNRWTRSLAVKQLIYIILFSSIITLLSAAIQLYMEYRSDINFVKTHKKMFLHILFKNFVL